MSAEFSAVIALALGMPVESSQVDWSHALQIAQRERLAPLAWLRGGNSIRALAGNDVARAWRAQALTALELSQFWTRRVTETLAVLDVAGVSAVIMKGLPLSVRLYGDPSARPCSDLDLFIPETQRAAAHEALAHARWRWRGGSAPGEAAYVTHRDGRSALLEVHSTLLDDDLVRHLPFRAPQAEPVELGGVSVPAHSDDQLPGFLAVHLSKHTMPPLLWLVDFLTLWDSLTAGRREAARSVARDARAHGYLEWAVQRSNLLLGAARGVSRDVRRLKLDRGTRSDTHNAVRTVSLASSRRDALRVVRAWAFPSKVRRHPGGFLRLCATRAALLARGRIVSQRRYDTKIRPSTDARTLGMSIAELADIVELLGSGGTPFWLRVKGTSMSPTVPSGALVKLEPRPQGGATMGELVLVRLGEDRFALHRVCDVGGSDVQTRGDGNLRPDPRVPASAILAVATIAHADGRLVEISESLVTRIRRIVRLCRCELASALRGRRYLASGKRS